MLSLLAPLACVCANVPQILIFSRSLVLIRNPPPSTLLNIFHLKMFIFYFIHAAHLLYLCMYTSLGKKILGAGGGGVRKLGSVKKVWHSSC